MGIGHDDVIIIFLTVDGHDVIIIIFF